MVDLVAVGIAIGHLGTGANTDNAQGSAGGSGQTGSIEAGVAGNVNGNGNGITGLSSNIGVTVNHTCTCRKSGSAQESSDHRYSNQ